MFRTAFATVLVVLGCLLAGPAVVAAVLVGEVTDRQSYLDAVGPLAGEPAVQDAVSEQITAALADQVPDQARQFVDSSIAGFVRSDEFRTSWVELNEAVHPQLLALLRDEPGALQTSGDAVVLDLAVVSEVLRERFVADGVPLAERLPDVQGRVEVVSGPAVRQMVPAFDLLEKLSVALPIASIALIVLGLLLSARRGKTLVVTGFGLVLVMLLVILAKWLARSQVAARSPSPELAGPFYDALTDRLGVVLWIMCAVGGALVVLGAVLPRRRPEPYSPQRRQRAAL